MRLSSCTPSLSWRLQQDQGPAYENFSRDQLDNLLSPVALYPDPLLAQVLTASTFSNQIPDAAGWARAHAYLNPDMLARAIRALVANPGSSGQP